MIWAAMSSAGVGPLCFLKSSQHSDLPGNFRALHASFCWQALWRCWFHFPAGLGTCPHCQMYQKLVQWPWCYCAWLSSNLAWPEPQRIYGVLSRGRWETPDPTMQMTWRPLSKQPGLLLHLSTATDWLASCHAALMQQFMQKECIEMNILFRSLTFLFKRSFFYWSYVIFKFSDTLNLGFLLSVSHNHQNLNK